MDRYIAGSVSGNGTIISGQEFSVSRTSKGHYVVSFRPGFAQVSGGAATQIYADDGKTTDNAVFIKINATEVFIKTGDSNGDAQDRDFSFIVGGTGSVPLKKKA